MKTAIPITGTTIDDFMQCIKKSDTKADVLEYRIDYLGGIRPTDLQTILNYTTTSEICLTIRKREEGGHWKLSEGERIQLLISAIAMKVVTYVDVELSSGLKTIAQIEKVCAMNKTKLIISYHDFYETPNFETLVSIVEQEILHHADICKVATFARTMEDNITMLRLLQQAKEQEISLIGICMGSRGKLTRLAGALLGSYMTFISLDEQHTSALGQLTRSDFEKGLKLLEIVDDLPQNRRQVPCCQNETMFFLKKTSSSQGTKSADESLISTKEQDISKPGELATSSKEEPFLF